MITSLKVILKLVISSLEVISQLSIWNSLLLWRKTSNCVFELVHICWSRKLIKVTSLINFYFILINGACFWLINCQAKIKKLVLINFSILASTPPILKLSWFPSFFLLDIFPHVSTLLQYHYFCHFWFKFYVLYACALFLFTTSCIFPPTFYLLIETYEFWAFLL